MDNLYIFNNIESSSGTSQSKSSSGTSFQPVDAAHIVDPVWFKNINNTASTIVLPTNFGKPTKNIRYLYLVLATGGPFHDVVARTDFRVAIPNSGQYQGINGTVFQTGFEFYLNNFRIPANPVQLNASIFQGCSSGFRYLPPNVQTFLSQAFI